MNQARKAYARQAGGAHEVYPIGRPMKQTRKDLMIIGFLDKNFVGVLQPYIDTLVVMLTIANHNVHRILVDNGSLVDILYWSMCKKHNLELEKIVPTSCPLMGFTGEQVQSLESIKLCCAKYYLN